MGMIFLITLGVSLYSLVRAYADHRDRVIDSAAWQSRQGVQQQLGLYFRDLELLAPAVAPLLSHPAIIYAGVHDLQGQALLQQFDDGRTSYRIPDFFQLRDGLGELEIGRRDTPFELGNYRFLDITIPVFSPVSPLEEGLSRQQFAQRLTGTGAPGSQHVAGYFLVGIDRIDLIRHLAPYAQQVAITALVTLLLVYLLIYLATRSITAPLADLADIAGEISKGDLDKNIKVRGHGEIREISSVLSVILGELRKHKAKMDTDRNLLAMKVEERTEQLSKRNQELTHAVRQVTQTKNQLRQLAYYDGLTKLPNRQLFTEQLDLLLRMAEREGRMIALLFLDLDNFKRINDSLGHSAGDMLLKEVATRLSACVRTSDLLAKYVDNNSKIGVSRLGGDEFTVVLNNIDEPATAGAIAQRLLEALQTPMLIDGHEVVVTPSVGIALAPRDANHVEDLLKLADTAMYHAKSGGRNKYSFYSPSMKSAGVGRLKLETELRKAVEREELVLHYQPQVCSQTGRIIGAEALVRWQHPKHGLIPPVRFIPLAEEMGLIVEIGNWTLLEAARQSKALQAENLDVPKIAVNVSALQFNPAFADQLDSVLKETGIDPSYIELELTEGVIMSDAKASIEALHSLKELGVGLSVDDFGTGYSSLNYLSRFPLDELKIDRSFVIDYDKSLASGSLISTIIAMGKSLNLSLVAEGVDTVDQFLFMRKHEVETIQGYLFSKPVPADEFAELLRSRHFPGQIEEMLRAGEAGHPSLVADG
jgi:diguanylate cyclase (GGDEF)-like protein